MKKYIVMLGMLVAAMGASLDARAQQIVSPDVQRWPEGKVVLADGEVLYGPLTYYQSQEVVNVRNEDGSIRSLSPVLVQHFVGQDLPSGRMYLFRALPWDLGRKYSDFKKPTFFEELNQGPLTLLRRQVPLVQTAGYANTLNESSHINANVYPVHQAAQEQIEDYYYILLPDGEIVTLQNVRKDLHKLFGKKSRKVKEYVKEHNLDYDRPYKLIAIVNYFNSL